MLNDREKRIIEGAIEVLNHYGWTKGFAARDCDDKPACVYSQTATCFCIYGALLKAGRDDIESTTTARSKLSDFILNTHRISDYDSEKSCPIFIFNDYSESKDEVIALLTEFLTTS